MVVGFIALLNVALIMAVLGQTSTLPFGGVTRVTVGRSPHETGVVNVHTKGSSWGLPNVSTTPVVTVAVKVEFGARVAEGTKVAVLVAST
jgi:hypothetical protein